MAEHATEEQTAPAGGAGAEIEPVDLEDKPDGYVVAPKVDLDVMVGKDAEDEAMRRYKASLLGAAANTDAVKADSETRHVVIHEMRIQVQDRPDIVIPLDTPADIAAAAANKVQVKEGCQYVTKIVFSVHKDVVLGLKFSNVVYGSVGIPLDRISQMMGSYPPDGKRNEFSLPVGEWPSGMFARGSYSASTKFTDDDGNTHLAFTWGFEIKKTWPDGT